MISWVLVIIIAYLFFSLSSFGDKLVLNTSKSPKLYVFYVGLFSLSVVFLIPFFGLSLLSYKSFFWIIFNSLNLIFGLYIFYFTVLKFEVSRVVPIVGAMQPLFVLFLSWVFWSYLVIELSSILAFIVLLLGSIVISLEKRLELAKDLIKFSLLTSFSMALGFILIKLVFLSQTFFNAIIWIGIFNFLFSLIFLFDSGVRKEFFTKKSVTSKKTIFLVLLTQMVGGLAGVLQNFAIYLAPASSLAIINVLRGIQYVFLFIITLIFSTFYPKILKEEISKKVVTQKTIGIILIIIGLFIISFY